MYTKEQIKSLFARSQAVLSLPENEREALLNKIVALPEEGQKAIFDILDKEQQLISSMDLSKDPAAESAQLVEKRNRLIAIENTLKHQVNDAREHAETDTDLDQILTKLN